MSGLFDLSGKVALVTGASRGLGAGMALALADAGADVAVHASEHPAQATETAIKAKGREARCYIANLARREEADRLIPSVITDFGRLDILVNNAAFQSTHESIEEFSSEEFERTFKTNVFAMFWLCKAAMPRMKPGSVIINTASIQAFDPSPTLLAYAPTKAAIVSFTKALSQSAMKSGIRVNAVAPGPVWTPLIPSTLPEKSVKKFGADTQFERAAQPVEISPVFVFLASNEARYVTGEVYGVTGGKSPY